MFDRDDNGYITRDELRSALEMIGEPVTDAQLNQVLALGDIDHDGRIDYEGECVIGHCPTVPYLGPWVLPEADPGFWFGGGGA